MRTSPAGLALIKRFEGFYPKTYLCPAGYPTIGYGHLLGPGDVFRVLTEGEADALLIQDVAEAEAAVARLIHVPLAQHQFDALVSFTFNLGAGALQRSTLRRCVNRGDHGDVPAEFLRWVYAGTQRLRGLERRRAAEAALYAGED